MSKVVDDVRSFNRFYTKVIGVLDEGLVGTPYSLAEARVLFELAAHRELDIADLRAALGLDPGYATRILDRLGAAGLVTKRRASHDARRQTIRLTPAGQKAFRDLNQRTVDGIAELLQPLGDANRQRLVASMRTVRELLEPHERAVELREPRPGDFGWIVERHGRLYAEEYGWDQSFEALVAQIVADFCAERDPQRERAWIATVDGAPAGSILCVQGDAEVAKLRLLLTEPWARGLGVGTMLVDACAEFARAAGYERLVLWTNDVLAAARRIYQRAGFELVDEEPHHSFGVDLVGQTWQLPLR